MIDCTKDHCVSYKPNVAFYESLGSSGWKILEETLAYIPSSHFVIADAKRGDIGNTSGKYASAIFDYLKADAVTVAPYMGSDSIIPFMVIPINGLLFWALPPIQVVKIFNSLRSILVKNYTKK